MNLMQLMQGQATYRAAYTLMLAGLFLMSSNFADLLDAPVMLETRKIIAEMLRDQGFWTFMAGWVVWGIRRAMEKGGAKLPPPTEEEKQQEAEALRQTLLDVEQKLQSLKGSGQS